ncbi:unnamed protein product [Amaranthus hypochondriacus]
MKKHRHGSMDGRFLNLFWIMIVITSISSRVVFCARAHPPTGYGYGHGHQLTNGYEKSRRLFSMVQPFKVLWGRLRTFAETKMSGIGAASKTDGNKSYFSFGPDYMMPGMGDDMDIPGFEYAYPPYSN